MWLARFVPCTLLDRVSFKRGQTECDSRKDNDQERGNHMKGSLCLLSLLVCVALAPRVSASDAEKRLDHSATVLSEIMDTPDKGIPQDLLEKAHCIVIVPGMKQGAVIVGGKFGKGYISCRRAGSGWSAPGAVRIEGGSVGLQIGGTETDVVLLGVNENGANKL